MFSMGFMTSVVSIIVGGIVAGVTVVGLVQTSVDSKPSNAGSVSGSVIKYGN